MKNEILGSAYSPAKIIQDELSLMKIGQSSQKYNRLKLKVNIALNVTYVFQTALLKNEIMRHKPYFLRAYTTYIVFNL